MPPPSDESNSDLQRFLEERIKQLSRQVTSSNKRGVRILKRDLRTAVSATVADLRSIQRDVEETKQSVDKIFQLLNGDHNTPGLIGRVGLSEERIRVNSKWIYAAIGGLIFLLFGFAAELMHIVFNSMNPPKN